MSKSPRKGLNCPKKGSPKKVKSFSWEIEGSDYVRTIAFKALKEGEKLGFGLGGEGQRTEVVVVREGTQAYWKGIKKSYKVVAVNGNDVNDITVKSSISDVATSAKNFTIGFLVPDKPDWTDSNKAGINSFQDNTGLPVDEQPEEEKTAVAKKESVQEEEDDSDTPEQADNKEENADDGFFNEDDNDEDYISLTKKIDELKEVEDISQEILEKATKAELEEMKRRKQEEYDKLKRHEAALRTLIRKKEMEFKEAVTRQNLEELKSMRRMAKAVGQRLKRALAELERIRRMLQFRLEQLAAGIRDLAAHSSARDLRLRELEAEVRTMEGKASKMTG